MENVYLYIGLGALIVVIIVALTSKKFKAKLSKNGFGVSADKNAKKDNVKVKRVKNKSKVDLTTKKDQNIDVEDIDSSDINIK